MFKTKSFLLSKVRLAFSYPQSQFALITLALLTLFALLTPVIATHSYFEINLNQINASIGNNEYLLGSDDLGRDLLVRLAMGTRISLTVGLLAAILDVLIGVWYGAIAAYFGGKIENVMMRLLDILETVPYFLIVIAIMMILKPGLTAILLAICLVSWIPTARIIRTHILQAKTQEYILYAKSLGASSFRILWKHLFPNIVGALLITMTLTVPVAIFTESILSFLGLGLQTPMSSLGSLCSDGLEALQTFPKRLFLPSFLIIALIMCFTYIGEGLKCIFDAKESNV